MYKHKGFVHWKELDGVSQLKIKAQNQDCKLMTSLYIKKITSWALVTHTCNPNYLGGRDQEDHGSKPTWANNSRPHPKKNPSQKKAGGVAQDLSTEFKPRYRKKRKRLNGAGV
jgi:hypothetical protein